MGNPTQPITLEEFVADAGDRDRSEIFAGRTAELDWLRKQVATMRGMWERQGEVRGSIRTVTGCPGIGKTALLRRFADECRDDYLIVEVTLDDLRSVEALNQRARARVAPVLKNLSSAVLGTFKLDAAGQFLGELTERHGIDRQGVLLLLDEAQQVATDRHDSVIHFLHTGAQGQPVFPLFFGLDDTLDSLERAGASRIPPENRISLSTLPSEDAQTVLRNFEQAFDACAPPDLTERLLADSQGFPQHLNSALRSLGEEWLRTGGGKDALNPAAVLDKAKARREAYYEGRFKPLANDPRAAGLIDLANRQALDIAQLHAAATRAYQDDGYAAKQAEDAAKALVGSMLRRGAVTENPDGVCRTPIPSFLKWIRDRHTSPDHTGSAQDSPSG